MKTETPIETDLTRRRRRRPALGRGLGSLILHGKLRRAALLAKSLSEEPLPPGMPSWARFFFRKVCRLGRKA